VWLVELAALAEDSLLPQTLADVLSIHDQPESGPPRGRWRTIWPQTAAAGVGQLRAPARRVRGAGQQAATGDARLADPGHQPAAGSSPIITGATVNVDGGFTI
jgi:hypothetical protein